MAAPMSSEARFLLKLLADGQWMPLAEVKTRLAAAVAPGKALRRYDRGEASRQLRFGPRAGPELSDDEKIASGQKSIATDTINSLKLRYIELRDDEEGIGRSIRRREEVVPYAGTRREQRPEPTPTPPPQTPPQPAREDPAAVARQPEAEPAQVSPAVAFFDADQVRTLITGAVETAVGETIDQALIAFQRGMQQWMIHRFAEIERSIDRVRPHREQRPQPPGTLLPRSLRRR